MVRTHLEAILVMFCRPHPAAVTGPHLALQGPLLPAVALRVVVLWEHGGRQGVIITMPQGSARLRSSQSLHHKAQVVQDTVGQHGVAGGVGVDEVLPYLFSCVPGDLTLHDLQKLKDKVKEGRGVGG